jgi:glycosyltransferase involved in cell wall biosynthesis
MEDSRILLDTTDLMIPGIFSGIHRVAESILSELKNTDITAINLYRGKVYENLNLDNLVLQWDIDKRNNRNILVKYLRSLQGNLAKFRLYKIEYLLTQLYSFLRLTKHSYRIKSNRVILNTKYTVVIQIVPIHRKSQLKFWNLFVSENRNGLVFLVHDLLPYFKPELFPRSRISSFNSYLNLIKKSSVVFFVSEQTRNDYIKYNAITGHNSIAQELKIIKLKGLTPQKYDSPSMIESNESFILMVSTFEPRKNHLLLLETVTALWEEGINFSLVFAGSSGWSNSEIWSQIKISKNKFKQKLYYFTDPSDQILDSLYKQCIFTIYPSSFEGYGLPIVESVNFGKPVICQELPATSDIDKYYFKCFDGTKESLGQEIKNLLKNGFTQRTTNIGKNIASPIFEIRDSSLHIIEINS